MICMLDDAGGWSHVGRCRRTSSVRGDTLITPDHIAFMVRGSGFDRAGIFVGLTGRALTRDATRSLRFVVHAAGWLQYMMMLHGRCLRMFDVGHSSDYWP